MNYYTHIAKGYDALHAEEQQRKKKIVLSIMPPVTGYILDIGCGTGLSLQKKMIGLDPSYAMVQEAKKKKYRLLVQGYGENLPFKDKAFDLVQCITALHNFHNWQKGLAEMQRVTKQWILLSLLKKAKTYPKIVSVLRQKFTITMQREDVHDMIFLCSI